MAVPEKAMAMATSLSFLPFDQGPYPRARLGFLCVANAGLTEGDMFAMRPPGVGLSFTRVAMQTACTVGGLAAMEHDLEAALSTLAPGRDDIDVITYNCTSGSFVIGEDVIRSRIEAARPSVKGTTLLTGVVAALRALGVTRLAVATAYTPDIDALEKSYLESRGFDVLAMKGLGLLTDIEMNRVPPQFIVEFATSLDRADADAIFISCGALRSLEAIPEIERRLGKPVIGSNQASFWHALRLAGINDRLSGFGCLLEHH
jgi:maleate isomerase